MAQRSFLKLYPHDHIMKYAVIPLIPLWVRPNHITVLRMIMTPFVIWLLFSGELLIGIPLFIFAAFTDIVDGSLARLRSQVTPWGIFFDPVADKLLIGSVALTIAIRYFHPIIVILAIVFDLLPSIIFLSRKHPKDQVMSANSWGKAKMFLQFSAMTLLLVGIFLHVPLLISAGEIVLAISLVFALIATVTYSL